MNAHFRVYYSVDSKMYRSRLIPKDNALALFNVHVDAFLVTKESGWWQRVLRFRSLTAGFEYSAYPR